MQSEWYNRCYESLDIVNGVERGKYVQHDAHVAAWRLETWRRRGWVV